MRAALAVAAAVVLLLLAWFYSPDRDAVATADGSPTPDRALYSEGFAGFSSAAWHLPNDELLGFVEVPGGSFLMGSEPGDSLAFDNERWAGGTRQPADVPTFFIGRYEVTVAQFLVFVEATDHPVPPETLQVPGNHPVTSITWTDALAYARWLDGILRGWGGTPAPIARMLSEGGRVTLPTEVQWEKAARGGDGRVYPWGNDLRSDRANFQSTSPKPVGSIPCPECAFGLSDMSGNVWEWTRTPFVDGPHGAPEAPPNLQADALFVMRGGSFADPARLVRAALRGGGDPGVRRPFIGFRVVISKE
jgi:formylglycine-generating enzyme required for sulfatase activity